MYHVLGAAKRDGNMITEEILLFSGDIRSCYYYLLNMLYMDVIKYNPCIYRNERVLMIFLGVPDDLCGEYSPKSVTIPRSEK